MHISQTQTSPSPPFGGGEGRGEVGGAAACGSAARPTSPSHAFRRGPLPLPPQAGGEGQKAPETHRARNVCIPYCEAAFRGSPLRPCRAPSGDNIGQQLAL